MYNIFSRIQESVANAFGKKPNEVRNLYNEAFLYSVGGGYTEYDTDGLTYIEKGYSVNPIVYSVVNQQATKTASIPFSIRSIKDKSSYKKLKQFRKATEYKLSPQQRVKQFILENKAFDEEDLDFPLQVPNTEQTWPEFIALWKTFMKTTGNAYMYMLSTDEGMNAGEPLQIYLLPSHLVQIVVKPTKSLMYSTEDSVQGYILVYGRQSIEFPAENVIHTKYPNPNYGENGEHLYGMSPLRAALKNIQSSNTGLDLNIKTLKSGGAFGFIHAKNQALTPDQASEIKSRLLEMNASPEDLSKIAGISAEIGFTRLSLTSDELKPFDYLNFDQKQICNVLQWDDILLNNDAGAKYDNVESARKRVVTDNIKPDLDIFAASMNMYFLPRFKNYQGMVLEFDISELPEMQIDTGELVEWLIKCKDRAILTGNECRLAINYPLSDDPDMDLFTLQNDVVTLGEAVDSEFNITNNN